MTEKWRKSHLEKHREYNKHYRERNPTKDKEYYERNRDKILIKNRENYLKNHEKQLEYRRRYNAKNKDKQKAISHNHYMKNKDIYKQRAKQWKKDNPRSMTGGSIELQLSMNNVRKRDNNTCQWQNCGLTHREAPIHVHHIFPRSEYPDWVLVEQYMICYCANHHGLWHRYRGDNNPIANLVVEVIREVT